MGNFLDAVKLIIPLALVILILPFMRTFPQKCLLVIIALLLMWILNIAISNYKAGKSIQGTGQIEGDTNFSTAPAPGSIFSKVQKFLGWQTPRRIAEMPDMFSPNGTIYFRYKTNQVEGRKVFGKRYFVDFRYQENKNRIALYLETINDSNYLILEIYTINKKKYSQKVKIDHWKNNSDYPIFVIWSNEKKEVKLLADGPEHPSALFKTEGNIFGKTGITAYLY